MKLVQNGKILLLKSGLHIVTEEIVVSDGEYYYHIPKKYVTDLVTVPKMLDRLFPPSSPVSVAAIFHDYLIDNNCLEVFSLTTGQRVGKRSMVRKEADWFMYCLMLGLGVRKEVAILVYMAISVYTLIPDKIRRRIIL